ncbi:hypothetical protein CP061683_0477A, partial [Chlamydia psittaci 06-1683]
MVSVKQLLSKP